MSRIQITEAHAICEQLQRLVGSWEGGGAGRFPTIDSFRYREAFEVTHRNPEEAVVHYHQQTWLVSDGEDDGDDSHWESGFIMAREDGRVELLNAQESRRVEVLVGEMYLEDSGACVLETASVVHAHDERMVATKRTIRYDEQTLLYRMEMTTTKVPEILVHLEAELNRR